MNANVFNRWREEFLKQAVRLLEWDETDSEAEQKIAELEQLFGQLTIQLESAKKPQPT